MINPQLLTKENGFEDGVVVELNGDVGRLHFDKDGAIVLNGYRRFEILSLRPLTGPMSIWNYAPEWSTWCKRTSNGDLLWYNIDAEHLENGTKRPFWATRSGE